MASTCFTTSDGGWYLTEVTFQDDEFGVDSRDYFIDFDLLVDAGFLQNIPQSASPDNGGGATGGSYSWYVTETGAVESLFYFNPSNGLAFKGTLLDGLDETPDVFTDNDTTNDDDGLDGTLDVRGFFDGVFP